MPHIYARVATHVFAPRGAHACSCLRGYSMAVRAHRRSACPPWWFLAPSPRDGFQRPFQRQLRRPCRRPCPRPNRAPFQRTLITSTPISLRCLGKRKQISRLRSEPTAPASFGPGPALSDACSWYCKLLAMASSFCMGLKREAIPLLPELVGSLSCGSAATRSTYGPDMYRAPTESHQCCSNSPIMPGEPSC